MILMSDNSLTKQIADVVQRQRNQKHQSPKRMTVAVSQEDYKLLAQKAQQLGISKTKYLNLLVSQGLND